MVNHDRACIRILKCTDDWCPVLNGELNVRNSGNFPFSVGFCNGLLSSLRDQLRIADLPLNDMDFVIFGFPLT